MYRKVSYVAFLNTSAKQIEMLNASQGRNRCQVRKTNADKRHPQTTKYVIISVYIAGHCSLKFVLVHVRIAKSNRNYLLMLFFIVC